MSKKRTVDLAVTGYMFNARRTLEKFRLGDLDWAAALHTLCRLSREIEWGLLPDLSEYTNEYLNEIARLLEEANSVFPAAEIECLAAERPDLTERQRNDFSKMCASISRRAQKYRDAAESGYAATQYACA